MTAFNVSTSELRFLNRTDAEMSLVLEPEGDVVQLPSGKVCQIQSGRPAQGELDCEIKIATGGEVTLYLAIVKQVYIDGERVR